MTGGKPYTIGLGLTFYSNGSLVKKGDRFNSMAESEAETDEVLKKYFLPHLEKIPHWNDMADFQKAALISFSWNLGEFYGTNGFDTISKALKSRNWNDVPKSLMLYRNPGSNVELGLGRRRYAEGLVWRGATVENAYEKASGINSVEGFDGLV